MSWFSWHSYYGDVIRTILTAVALIGVGIILLNQANSNSHQLDNQTHILKQQQQTVEALNSLSKEQKSQIDQLQQHIDCVVSLFTQPNRLNLVITDISNCKLTSTNSGAVVSTQGTINSPKPSTPATASPSAPASQSSQVSSTPQPHNCWINLFSIKLFCK